MARAASSLRTGISSAVPTAHGLTVGIGGHAVTGDAEHARDLYAAAAAAWVEAGHRSHMVFVPSSDEALVDAWFRLSFGASAVLATRETAGEEPYDGDVAVRPGTPDDFGSAARLELAMFESMRPSPSFSAPAAPDPGGGRGANGARTTSRRTSSSSPSATAASSATSSSTGGRPTFASPRDAIDLGQASTFPEARGTGVGRALTAHAIRWAHEHGHPTMVTDWRMTNLLASRFWPRRGFRTTFLRLNRVIA